MQPALTFRPIPYRYENLSSFTRQEVLLWNWYARAVSAGGEWKSWVRDILGHLIERPAGKQFHLVETHLADPQFGEKIRRFGSKQELFIGRDPANDIVLSATAIASRNTRLFLQDGQVCVEDLGGKLGTYVCDKKIAPNQVQTLADGDQFTVFPHRFRVLVEQAWQPETDVAVSECGVQALDGTLFWQMSPVGWRSFAVNAHPGGEQALLQVSATFLSQLQERVLGPLELHSQTAAAPSDDALLGFIVLAAIERLNRTLRFPAQFCLARGTENTAAGAERGILLTFAVGLGGLTGHFRIFLPMRLLAKCKPEAAGEAAPTYPNGLCWAFPVSVGFVDLLPDEIAQVGLGDALVIQPQAATLFPNDFSRGWAMEEDGSNFARFKFDKYFERGTSVDTSSEAAAAASRPAIEALPLRLHVVVGEKEFTLAEVQALSPGTIVELEATKADPVRLMVNGKILGEGELVEVEGSLAVRVLRWRNP